MPTQDRCQLNHAGQAKAPISGSWAPTGLFSVADQLSIPLAVMTPSMGSFRALARNIDALRRSAIRVYLPCNNPDNLAALRILSWLGIHVCAQFDTSANVRCAGAQSARAIFIYCRQLQSAFEPPVGLIEFDDPSRFLHLDEEGRVALSRDELKRGVFVAQNVDEVGSPAVASAISEWENRWRRFFTDNHP